MFQCGGEGVSVGVSVSVRVCQCGGVSMWGEGVSVCVSMVSV